MAGKYEILVFYSGKVLIQPSQMIRFGPLVDHFPDNIILQVK